MKISKFPNFQILNLIEDILRHRSLAIVGLEKNTGKTECLNYVLRSLPDSVKVAVTSIGTDGERVDAVTRTSKPEIWLREGTVFGTAERYYESRDLVAEVLDVGERTTSLGRTVTARALSAGKVMLSGPPSTAELKRWMDSLDRFGTGLTIVDGALSRMSSASPAVTEAMLLSTGAAFSADMNTLVRETAYRVELINLPLAKESDREFSCDIGNSISAADDGKGIAVISGTKLPDTGKLKDAVGDSETVFVEGALTPRLLNALAAGKSRRVIVGDFTKIFVSSQEYRTFISGGGRIEVMRRSELLAVCVNPVAPNGMVLDSDTLIEKMSAAVTVPVYNIMKN